jgi:hypothetical protein
VTDFVRHRTRHRGRAALTALLSLAPLLGAGECTISQPVRVLAPSQGDVLTWMPLGLEVDHTATADAGTLAVRLNGVDITALLVMDPPSGGRVLAFADGVWGTGLVEPGENVLEAEVEVDGTLHHAEATFTTEGDPYADAVTSTLVGTSGGFNQSELPDVVLGPPHGAGLYGGGLDVYSLGINGQIVLAFTDNVIVDGPGFDFTVFENPFLQEGLFEIIETIFSEAGEVSVSQDGTSWYVFPCDADDPETDHPLYPGCAGVYPVLADGDAAPPHPTLPTLAPAAGDFIGMAKPQIPLPEGSGGDSFDLSVLGLGWARYVRIIAADHVVGPAGPDNAGFDLDAIAAVHSAPATDADGDTIPDAVQ